MKKDYSEQEKFVSGLLTFVFIFVIIVIAVVSIHYSGILNFKNDAQNETTSEQTTKTFETYPPGLTGITSSSSKSEQTVNSGTTSQSATKYAPATVPSITREPPKTSTSQQKPTETTTQSSENTTQQSTQENPPVTDTSATINPEDITDEAMAKLITKKYLSIRSRSRSGNKLWSVNDIAVHYVCNPGTSAINNWKYFETQKLTLPSGKPLCVSAHFIIDMDGSIIQCMPLDEVAWAVGTTPGNYTSISIECCHPDETGKFTDATYESLVKLVSWLCNQFDLNESNVKRHYDYTGKACPIYFSKNAEEWQKFKDDLLIN